jgi:hypothetical protein
MEKDIKQILSKSMEVNILLNSNMLDVVENTKDTSKICNDIKQNISANLSDIVKESKNSLTCVAKETDKMISDNKLNNEAVIKILNQASTKSIHDAKESFDNTQRLMNSYFSEMGNLLNQSKNVMANEFVSVLTQSRENTKAIIDMNYKLSKKFDIIKSELSTVNVNVSNLKDFVDNRFGEFNETMCRESKKTRIIQAIYFALTITILLIALR